MKYGYIADTIAPDHYVFGAQLSPQVLQEDGQWDDFLPSIEHQNVNGVETYACASFGTLSAVEMLLKRIYTVEDNFSDRFLAKVSGTQYSKGNSPHTVAEHLRKLGTPPEEEYPFDAKTFEEYYQEPPKKAYDYAREFVTEFDFGHDWVPTHPEALKAALKTSPLGVSVFAWLKDPHTGHYVRGGEDNHWCVLYGYVDGKHWKLFDSYDNTLKTVAWDYAFGVAKRYTLLATPLKKRKTIAEILRLIGEALGLIQKQVEALPKPPEPVKVSRIVDWAKATQTYEGYAPGTRAYRNKNPGNIKYLAQPNTIGKDDKGFAIFKTYEDGFNALCTLLRNAATGKSKVYKPNMTLLQFYAVYAPSSDHNNPDAYAKWVANRIGVKPEEIISNLV